MSEQSNPSDEVVVDSAPVEQEESTTTNQQPPPTRYFTLTLSTSRGEQIKVQASSDELVVELRQVVLELAQTCFETQFELRFNGNSLSDASTLGDYQQLDEGSVVDIVELPYTETAARHHLQHFRNFLVTDAYQAGDSLVSLIGKPEETTNPTSSNQSKQTQQNDSFLPDSITKGSAAAANKKNKNRRKKKKTGVIPASGGEHKEESEPVSVSIVSSLADFFPPQPKPITSPLISLVVSGWSPAPPNRRLQGDLFYLEAVTKDEQKLFITASTEGFFINRSTETKFDWTAASPSHQSHTLAALLAAAVPGFKDALNRIVDRRFKKHPYEVVSMPVPAATPVWVLPANVSHSYDPNRADNFVANRSAESAAAGTPQSREWNEEYQQCLSLPLNTYQEGVARERAVFMVRSDFVNEAVAHAIALVDGNIEVQMGSPEESPVLIDNGIFYSFAIDSRELYTGFGGSETAKKLAGRDVVNTSFVASLENDALSTVLEAVIDYRGQRVIAQAVIPGILSADPISLISYGSMDAGQTIECDEKSLVLLQKLSQQLSLKEHSVTAGDGKTVKLSTSTEVKLFNGTDNRKYLLDLARLTVSDPNFPTDPSAVARLELIDLFIDYKRRQASLGAVSDYFKKVKAQQTAAAEAASSAEASAANPEASAASAEASAAPVESNAAAAEQTPAVEGKGEASGEASNNEEKKAEKIVVDFVAPKFNPNALVPASKATLSDDPQTVAQDEATIRELFTFLTDALLPSVAQEWIEGRNFPADGSTLKQELHARGINLRYLGRLALAVALRPFEQRALERAMAVRSAVRLFDAFIRPIATSRLAAAIAHFLNCLLSRASDIPTSAEFQLTPALLRTQIKREVAKVYGYDLDQASAISNADLANYAPVDSPLHAIDGYGMSTLRDFCLQSGVRIAAVALDFDSATPIDLQTIVGLTARVKWTGGNCNDGVNSSAIAIGLFDAANMAFGQEQIDTGLQLLNQALAVAESTSGPLQALVGKSYLQLAAAIAGASDLSQAAGLQRRGIAVLERVLGPDHPFVSLAYCTLGQFCQAVGSLENALAYTRRGLYLLRLTTPESHPMFIDIFLQIGSLMQASNNHTAALAAIVKSMQIAEQFYGDQHLVSAALYRQVAIGFCAMTEYKTALQYEMKNFHILKAHYSDDNPLVKESNELLMSITANAVQLQRQINKQKTEMLSKLTQSQLSKMKNLGGSSRNRRTPMTESSSVSDTSNVEESPAANETKPKRTAKRTGGGMLSSLAKSKKSDEPSTN